MKKNMFLRLSKRTTEEKSQIAIAQRDVRNPLYGEFGENP